MRRSSSYSAALRGPWTKTWSSTLTMTRDSEAPFACPRLSTIGRVNLHRGARCKNTWSASAWRVAPWSAEVAAYAVVQAGREGKGAREAESAQVRPDVTRESNTHFAMLTEMGPIQTKRLPHDAGRTRRLLRAALGRPGECAWAHMDVAGLCIVVRGCGRLIAWNGPGARLFVPRMCGKLYPAP